MLTGGCVRAGCIALAIGTCLCVVAAEPAGAKGRGSASGWDGGQYLGVTASVPGSPPNSSPAAPSPPVHGGGGSSGPTVSPIVCSTYPDPSNTAPAPVEGGAGRWGIQTCAPTIAGASFGDSSTPVWVAAPPPPPPPPPNPGTVAAEAAAEIPLPSPVIGVNPGTFGVVNFPEWFWVAPTVWHSVSVSATACNAGGCVTATAAANPVSVYFSTGDGSGVTCNGPGAVYNTAAPAYAQSTYCAHTYAVSSLGQPSPDGNPDDAAFPVSATITWTVSWYASGAASGAGTLPDMTTSSSTSLRVEQIESVVSG